MYSFFCKAQQKLKEIGVVEQQPQKVSHLSHKQDILQKKKKQIFSTKTSSDRSLRPTGSIAQIVLRLWGFYVSGTQDAEVTKSLKFHWSASVHSNFYR